MKTVLGLLLLSASVTAQDAAPDQTALAFDCAKTRDRVEKMLCADTQLASLDRQLADLVATASSHAADPDDLRKDQRRWLRDRDDCEEPACVKNHYELRLDELTTYTGRFPNAAAMALCARFIEPDTRIAALESKPGIEDINNDGRPEVLQDCPADAAQPSCAIYVDTDRRPLAIQPQGYDWSSYAALGRTPFRHDGRTFIYYSRDAALEQPAYITYVTPTNRELRVCDFHFRINSVVKEGGADVCAAVETGERIEAIELTEETVPGIMLERPDIRAARAGTVDIDNDGLDEDVIELSYQSPDQDCTFKYFELLAPDRKSLLGNSNGTPVRELQGLSADGYRERLCGRIENRLFRFGDKVYYETNVTNNERVPHEVRALDGTAVATLCTFEREETTRIKTVF